MTIARLILATVAKRSTCVRAETRLVLSEVARVKIAATELIAGSEAEKV